MADHLTGRAEQVQDNDDKLSVPDDVEVFELDPWGNGTRGMYSCDFFGGMMR